MRVSAKTDYALRALLVLAAQAPGLVKVEALSAAEGMPRRFVEIILGELRRAGLVVSQRGSDGGFGLALPPERITVGDVVRILDGPLGGEPVRGHPGSARVGAASGHLAEVWNAATASVADVLDAATLAHLLSGELPEHVRALAKRAVVDWPDIGRGHRVTPTGAPPGAVGCAGRRLPAGRPQGSPPP